MPVVCLSWETAHLYGEAWISHHRLRHRLFVERHHWDVPSYNGIEHDEFDTPAAQYLLWIDDAGETRGAARLLQSTRPYMLEKLWPELISGEPPHRRSIWEATRFGCDQTLSQSVRRKAVAEILCGMQEFGMRHGIDRYLAVMPLRLLKCVVVKAGCRVEVLGPPQTVGRYPTVAAYLAVSSDVLGELRRRAGLRGPVLGNDLSIPALEKPRPKPHAKSPTGSRKRETERRQCA